MKRTHASTSQGVSHSSVLHVEPPSFFSALPGLVIVPGASKPRPAAPPPQKAVRFDVDLQAIQDPLRKVRLEALVQLSNSLRGQDVEEVVPILRRQLKIESDSDIKVIIVNILCSIACVPSVDANIVVEDLVEQAKSPSRKIQLQVLQALLCIGKSCSLDVSWLLGPSSVHLQSPNAYIRAAALRLLAAMADKNAHTADQVQRILASFTEDADPRVRAAAFQGIYIQHQRGITLDVKLYHCAVNVLNDDYDIVRLEAIKAVWALSNSNPNYILSVAYGGEKLRLVDDGFAKLCQAVMDAHPSVRTLACSLMGNLRQVSPHYLRQTLSKEPLKASSSATAGAAVTTAGSSSSGSAGGRGGGSGIGDGGGSGGGGGGGSSSGASGGGGGSSSASGQADEPSSSLAGAEPEGEIAVFNDVPLIDAGAAGAFVHGLEDEYMEVRSAAIDSICELSLQSDQFAVRAVEFLVDMFSDELESIRVNAIASVRKICASGKIELREEQLHVVLAVLEDAGAEMRMATHKLLSHAKLSNITCLHASIQALIHNISRYPQDKESIMHCLRDLGKRHPSFTEFIVEDLLHIDPRFISVEPIMDDISYNCIMVVLLNSAKANRTILALLPPYCRTHYHFLRDRFPDCFPVLLDWDDAASSSSASASAAHLAVGTPLKAANRSDVRSFMRHAIQRLESAVHFIQVRNFQEANHALAQSTRDFAHIAKLDPPLRPNTAFYGLYLTLLRHLLLVRQHQLQILTPALAGKILRACYKMQHTFSGLDNGTVAQILMWRVFAHLIHLVSALANTDQADGNNDESSFHINSFVARLKNIQTLFADLNVAIPPELESLAETASQMLTPSSLQHTLNPLSHAASTTHLLSLLSAFTPAPVALNYQLKRIVGRITSPVPVNSASHPAAAATTNAQQPERNIYYDVYSTFPLRIDIDAILEGIGNVSTVKVLVQFAADGTRRLFNIDRAYFTAVKPGVFRVQALPILLHINKCDWRTDQDNAGVSSVGLSISIVNEFAADAKYPDLDLVKATADSPTQDDIVPYVTLCKPVHYCIFPRER